jgi:TonB family protein
MNRVWKFKLFLSISLGLHFFVFSLLSILLPEMKIIKLPVLNIDISLLPLAREEESPKRMDNREKVQRWELARLPDRQGVRSEEKEYLKVVEKRETEAKSESPVANPEEKRVSRVEEAAITLPVKEQEPVVTSPIQGEAEVISVSVPKPYPLQGEKKVIEDKQEERVAVASLGNTVPQASSSEKPHVAMKPPSLSESEIIFAQPRYAQNPKPLYPREAKKRGYEGEVLLRVEVLSNGRVGEIEVKRSSGHEVLDRSAMTAVRQWRFVPARKGETPVPVWVNIPVAFQLR